jgi:hypothetical protein
VTRPSRRYAERMPERQLQQAVADMCSWLGLYHYHPRNSAGSAAGWPDSVIVGTRVIFAELKAQAGRLSPEQRAVGERLKAAGADWRVWRPGDWISGAIERELRLLRPTPTLPFPTQPKE